MSTTYLLVCGYEGSGSCHFEQLHKIAKTISIEKLKKKCLSYGLTEQFESIEGCDHTLNQYLQPFENLPNEDISFRLNSFGIQMDVFGIEHRNERETIRRAFSVLVLDMAFKQNIPVSLKII